VEISISCFFKVKKLIELHAYFDGVLQKEFETVIAEIFKMYLRIERIDKN